MLNKYRELFNQWKEKQLADWAEYEEWHNTLSPEEMDLIVVFRMAYEYGFNTSYNDGKEEI